MGQKGVTKDVMGIPIWDRREKGKEEIPETIITENFAQINIRHQTTDTGSQRTPTRINIKQNKTTKNLSKHIFKLQKIKYKEKNLKKVRGEKSNLPIEEKRQELYITSQKPCMQEEILRYSKC